MSATVTRPACAESPMLTEDDVVWIRYEGMWLGLEKDTRPETVERALAALQWIVGQSARCD